MANEAETSAAFSHRHDHAEQLYLSSGHEPLFTTFTDATRLGDALIVVGPRAGTATRGQAREIARRMHRL